MIIVHHLNNSRSQRILWLLDLFVLQTMSGRDSNCVAYASIPFFFMMLICIVLITIFPEIATWLPDALLSKPR